MSVDTYRRSVQRKKDEISKLKNERLRYASASSSAGDKITRAKKQLSSTKSESTIKSKLGEISREEKKKNDADKKISEYDKKIAGKEKELIKEEQNLQKEENREADKLRKSTKESFESIGSELMSQRWNQKVLENEIIKLKQAKGKITILFVASNPSISYYSNGVEVEQQKLNLDKEAREIREAITKSLNRDSIIFETRWATRTTDLFQSINETNPSVIHFSGHGSDDGSLVFQDNNDNPKLVSRQTVVEMIKASSDDVRLVVFNNCYSSQIAENIIDNVEAAIGMNTAIGDAAAIVFAAQLYSAIGFGKSIKNAFSQAKVALMLEGISEENTPQLFVNESLTADEIVLVDA